MTSEWPQTLPAVQVRIARPTDRFDEVIRFYHEGLSLPIVGRFEAHAGYDGVMIGLPDRRYHLEFTRHVTGSPCPAPTHDNLLVFYIPDQSAITLLVERLTSMGHVPVEPENPYWRADGITIEDPDGWRVVLMHASGI